MDIFKAMGVTVGNDIKMIDQIESKTLEKGDESTQIVRKGSDISARERLEGQIEKGFVMSRAPQHAPGHDNSQTDYAGTLKNTHGENWHTDNDKTVEDFLSAAAPIDREFPAESKPNTKTPRHPGTYAPTGEQSHTLEFKSLSQEELFMKAFNEVDEVVVKGKKKKFDFDKDGKIDAHEEHHAEMEAEKACGVSKKSDLDDIFDVVKGFNNAPPKMGVSKKAPKLPKDPVQIKQEAAQNKDLGVKKGTTEEDAAGMSVIAPDPYAANPDLIATVHENSPDVTERLRPAPFEKANKFIKAMGPGGVVFDFGNRTGNPIADRATDLLNQFSDPIQANNARYNESSYQKAITDYAVKGDAAYAKQTTMFGNIDKEWSNQLDKPMDQQVKEAFEKGELDNADPSTPAIKNDFNKTELNLGGQVIKATSETDAAIIEMMKAQNMSMPSDGVIADASSGGRISITAGEPLPQV